MSPAEIAEPIKTPFWMLTRGVQGTMYQMVAQIPSARGTFMGHTWSCLLYTMLWNAPLTAITTVILFLVTLAFTEFNQNKFFA